MTSKGKTLPYLFRPKEILLVQFCFIHWLASSKGRVFPMGSSLFFSASTWKKGSALEVSRGGWGCAWSGLCVQRWPFLGAAGNAVSMASFPRSTLCELEMCCSGFYITSDKFMLFLECLQYMERSCNTKLNQNNPWKWCNSLSVQNSQF